MRPFSYRFVDNSGQVTSGTDYTGAHASVEAFAQWRRTNNPGLVEVAVWAGELSAMPAHLRAEDSQDAVLTGAVA